MNVEVDFNRSMNTDIMLFSRIYFHSNSSIQKQHTTLSLSVCLDSILFLLKLILNYFLAIA